MWATVLVYMSRISGWVKLLGRLYVWVVNGLKAVEPGTRCIGRYDKQKLPVGFFWGLLFWVCKDAAKKIMIII